jgi:hypothetical protein
VATPFSTVVSSEQVSGQSCGQAPRTWARGVAGGRVGGLSGRGGIGMRMPELYSQCRVCRAPVDEFSALKEWFTLIFVTFDYSFIKTSRTKP